MSLDNSSCNLASLNLLKFLKDDDTFDAATFAKAVEMIITAMDISICFADFPTEAIGDTTRDYRQLGIGYANLGALLMATGLAYDSDGGRALAAGITSLMTGTAYKRSAELAGVVGPYNGYARNAEAHKRVMRKHLAANDSVRTHTSLDGDVLKLAIKAWQDTVAIGEKNGFRNAQASVLAPTGTIGFMMDCDTTGIEPDFSLVKFKKLVGGGSMQIVNQTIPRALRKLGYAEETVEAIVEYIAEHGHVVDAPGLKTEHYSIFDCAMGERSISPMGHVRMMAAAQPFLSGAISKTVNMPETATVEEVEDIYFQSWKLGIKALAIYRDNCKVGQPLSGGKGDNAGTDSNKSATVETVVVEKAPEPQAPAARAQLEDHLVLRRRRRGLHDGRRVRGRQARRGLHQDVEAGLDPGRRHGRLLDLDLDRSAVRRPARGVRVEVRQHALRPGRPDGRQGHPHGAVGHGLPVPSSRARVHGLRRARRLRHLLGRGAHAPGRDRLVRGRSRPRRRPRSRPRRSRSPRRSLRSSRRAPSVNVVAKEAPREVHSSAELLEKITGTASDSPMCMTCGVKMRPAGSCYVCEGCGSTSGCS